MVDPPLGHNAVDPGSDAAELDVLGAALLETVHRDASDVTVDVVADRSGHVVAPVQSGNDVNRDSAHLPRTVSGG